MTDWPDGNALLGIAGIGQRERKHKTSNVFKKVWQIG